MRKAALIYNPTAGRNRHLHLKKVETAASVLRAFVREIVCHVFSPG